MTTFTIHTKDSAPADSQPLLKKSEQEMGMVPNLHGIMAESPATLEAYQTLHNLAQQTSFTKDELTVVWLSVSVEHGCGYCVPAHTAIGKKMEVDDKIISALREEKPLPDNKLETLRDTTLSILRNRSNISDNERERFYLAGYTHQHLLEIVCVMCQKIMSNYINNLAQTPLDDAFKDFKWRKE
ncbi:carboxymuconolactone decarboxylase family protein [Alteromonas sp. ASW11-130]|uniref:carboxymuconolactone decarboxylase family protein n=1 Tax=Alteromonas sp. ASW11-130 TaxID=3015775 RepID=UPI0022428E47|nr:carboxymuconolactone decarboxylase family protein [Alteromonas sp. ASW11-130]MCW8092727.1 carboxymuconolactone decarboxylase family protein [Alteromonas sp. ASW11-130]